MEKWQSVTNSIRRARYEVFPLRLLCSSCHLPFTGCDSFRSRANFIRARIFEAHAKYVLQEKSSPAGNFVATSFVDTGGGAAGWCDAEVECSPTGTELPMNEEVSSRLIVERRWTYLWDAENVLRISFTPDDVDFGVTQYAWTKDRCCPNKIRRRQAGSEDH